MFVIVVDLTVVDGQTNAFMPIMRKQARKSLELEPGCHHFDICVDPDDPHTIMLYEVYDDAAAFQTHLKTDHFAEFDVAAQPLMSDRSARAFQRDG